MLRSCLITLSITALMWLSAPCAHAAEPFKSEHTMAELVSAPHAIAANTPLWVGVRFSLKPHWHMYWENPGDSGLATSFTWQLPEGFSAGPIHWQPPKRIPYGGLYNYGYDDSVVLLAPITPPDGLTEGTHEVTLKASWLVCDDICIPESANFSIALSTSEPDASAMDEDELQALVSTMPKPFKGKAEYTTSDGITLSFAPEEDMAIDSITNAWWFPVDDGIIGNDSDQTLSVKDGLISVHALRGQQPIKDSFSGMLALTDASGQTHHYSATAQLLGEATPVDSPIATQPANFDTSSSMASVSLLSAIMLAFIGGLILNVMPCVLPILSLKALSIAKKSGTQAGKVRAQGIAYTMGILVSFSAMAGLLLILQQTGHQIGWGFQLQSPAFVTALIYILFLVGLNLSGVFEIPSSFAGAGHKRTQGDSTSSSFFTGILATLVATPCTAPFMATALGFALSQDATSAMIIFLSLGFGLAFPLLLISFVPPLYRLLPKPGYWMIRFRQLIAFPIYASVAWLVWVLAQQVGAYGLAYALAGICIIAFAAWLLPLIRGFFHLLLLIATLAAVAVTIDRQSPEDTASGSKSMPTVGEVFTPELLQSYREQGIPVMVDATAAWCLTCKVNERVALNDESVKQAFKEKNVHLLVADWTNRDETITRYLASFNRSGVPIYVYYAPLKNPVILPQLLTPAIIREAIQ